jgi:hypothetical protein
VLLARGQGMGGESSDDWRSVLDDLIGREPPQPSASLTPHPTMRVRDYIRGANSAGSGRQQSYRCTINVPLHDKHVFDTHVLAARQNGP